MRAGELQRVLQREREPKAVHEPEAEREHPARASVRRDDVLDGRVEDRRGDQHLDQRWEPQRRGRSAVRRAEQRDGVPGRKRRDDPHQRFQFPAERHDEAEQEQQMIRPVENVRETLAQKPQQRLRQTRIERHDAGLAFELERVLGAGAVDEPQRRDLALAQPLESRPDREPGAGPADGTAERGGVVRRVRPHDDRPAAPGIPGGADGLGGEAGGAASGVRVPAAQPGGGDQQRTQSRADWRRRARSGRGPAGSCPRSSCAQMRRLFLVPAGTARLNPYRRTADGEELCRIRERSPCCGEHPIVEHQLDREAGVSGRIRTLPRRSSPEPFLAS